MQAGSAGFSRAPRAREQARRRRPGGSTSWASATARRLASIEPMRFPVVLLDLDGTVVDSGPIILASMRHATLSVLAREIPDAELMASVGGPGLEAQMRSFGPDQVDELVRVYREHNEPLHEQLEAFAGIAEVLVRLKEEG